MKLQFVDADHLLPGALMTQDIAHRLISLYNPYTGVVLSASTTLEGVVRLSSGFYKLISRGSSGELGGAEGTNAEISRRIGSVWGGHLLSSLKEAA